MVPAVLCGSSNRIVANSLWKIRRHQPLVWTTRRCMASSKDPPSGGGGDGKDGNKGEGSDNNNSSVDKEPYRIQRPFQPVFGPKSHTFFSGGYINPYKRYNGGTARSLKLVKDSSQFAILIPGRPVDSESDSPNRESNSSHVVLQQPFSNDNKRDPEEPLSSSSSSSSDKAQNKRHRRRRRKLPIVNAAALLDTQSYCKKSAFPGGIVTRSGTEAAKRLLRGKKDLLDMLRGVVILQQGHRPFCLAGHGVPKQLLQDHINMADSMLRAYGEPAEISFRNHQDDTLSTSWPQQRPLGSTSVYPGATGSASNMMSSHSPPHPVAPDSIRIRGHDGKSRIWEWPPRRPIVSDRDLTTINRTTNAATMAEVETSTKDGTDRNKFSGDTTQDKYNDDDRVEQYQWEDQMMLFLTVMDRISNHLGLIGSTRPHNHEGVLSSPAKHWTIKIFRGMAFPREVISRLDGEAEEDYSPVPILEWSPFKRLSYKQPHFTIRLQGIANTLSIASPANPVTLVFDACFHDDGSIVEATGS